MSKDENSMQTQLQKSHEVVSMMDIALKDLQINEAPKFLIPSLFFSTAIEHFRSIIILIENNYFGSASTLVRSLFESYVKGIWFASCATEKDFLKLQQDKFEKPFGSLVSQLANTGRPGLVSVKKDLWCTLNSFTHSGSAQLSRRINPESFEIIPSYDNRLIVEILNFSTNYGYLPTKIGEFQIKINVVNLNDNTYKYFNNRLFIKAQFEFEKIKIYEEISDDGKTELYLKYNNKIYLIEKTKVYKKLTINNTK